MEHIMKHDSKLTYWLWLTAIYVGLALAIFNGGIR